MATRLLFASERACAENPGGLDQRATLLPEDVVSFVEAGFDIHVEAGLGAGLGLLDAQYMLKGAKVEHYPDAYRHKDAIVKIKGPPDEAIRFMDRGTTLLTMGHIYTFPERGRLLAAQGANLVAMECITGNDAYPDAHLAGLAAAYLIEPDELGELPGLRHVANIDGDIVKGFVKGVLRRTNRAVYVRPCLDTAPGPWPQSSDVTSEVLLEPDHLQLRNAYGRCRRIAYSDAIADPAASATILTERQRVQRRIGCLRETGVGGAEYGVDLALRSLGIKPSELRALVIGYGNVAAGAIDVLRKRHVAHTVLGRNETESERLAMWVAASDLVINGADADGVDPQDPDSRYLLPSQLVGEAMSPGQVVIDLIGGSPQRRSPVEDIPQPTFLPDIHFERNGVYFASLWGWAMYHSMMESSRIFSRQIADLLTEDPRYAVDFTSFTTRYRAACQVGGASA